MSGRGGVPLPRVLSRERLLDRLQSARIGVVEAGGGYGKSLLAEAFRLRLGVGSAVLRLRPADAEPGALGATLQRALRTARLSDLAVAIEGREGLEDVVEGLLDVLARTDEPVLLTIDDAHHASGDETAELVVELVRRIPPPHRALVLARSLPAQAEPLRHDPAAVTLTTADMAFDAAEARSLFESFGVVLPEHAVDALWRATGGWPAALALWAPRIAASADPLAEAQAAADAPALLGPLLRGVLGHLDDADRQAIVQLAHLPHLSRDVAAAATSLPGVLDRAVAAGLPLAQGEPGWWQLPDPVAEHLSGLQPLEGAAASGAARCYVESGDVVAALMTLLAGGRAEEAASLLADLPAGRAERLSPAELRATVDALPAEAVRASPRVLLQLARGLARTYQAAERSQALARAAELAAAAGDEPLAREVNAETALDLVREGETSRARDLALGILRDAGEEELAARARSLHCVAVIESLWEADRRGLDRTGDLLREASLLARRAGFSSWAASSLSRLAEDTLMAACRYEEAVATLDEALTLLTGRGRARAVTLTNKADALLECGRLDEAEIALEEARAIGRTLADERILAYAAWTEAVLGAQLGDRGRVAAAAEEVERRRGDWFEGFAGLGYLTAVADAFDRVGDRSSAISYLERARPRAHQDEREFRTAEALIAARSGDPQVGARLTETLLSWNRLFPYQLWRLRLLRAFAAHRAGDPSAPALAAAAFDYCEPLGIAALPLVTERAAAEQLLPVAAAAGSRAAGELLGTEGTVSIRALGRFEISRGPRPLNLPPGRPTAALKSLVAAGGRLHAEELIEQLWPEVAPAAGRARLRNLLSRLRAAAGDVAVRDADSIALAPTVDVDVARFEDEARKALAAARSGAPEAVAFARAAVGRYRGPLLPDDPYESWAAAARERLRGTYLRLVDLLAADAARSDDVDEAARLLEHAIEAEPYDEVRYARLARLLASQGRIGSAQNVLDRARVTFAELDLEPSFDAEEILASASQGDAVLR